MEVQNSQQVNEWLFRFGYPWAPTVLAIADLTQGLAGPVTDEGEEIPCPGSVKVLSEDNPARIEMLRLAQEMMFPAYEKAGIEHHGRRPVADGKDGPATFDMMSLPRCGCPDFAPPTVEGGVSQLGTGPWKSCHGIGDFHAAHIRFTNAPPSHLNGAFNADRTIFQEALRRTRASYGEIGLRLFFSGPGTEEDFLPPVVATVQSNASFVGSSSGWIGLAIVGNNGMTCSSNAIWAQFLQSFASSSSAESKAHAWHLLLAHEFGHNTGLGHTSGGIMNPSLNTSSDGRWIGDVAESWMKGRFGGVAVPDDGPEPPDPPVPPVPPVPPDPDGITWRVVLIWILKAILDILTRKSSDKEFEFDIEIINRKGKK